MVWYYKREQASLSVETRYDNETAEYVAIVVRPDGHQQTERFLTHHVPKKCRPSTKASLTAAQRVTATAARRGREPVAVAACRPRPASSCSRARV
jgi:hypothetical protein